MTMETGQCLAGESRDGEGSHGLLGEHVEMDGELCATAAATDWRIDRVFKS
jgi:hypothetical protein